VKRGNASRERKSGHQKAGRLAGRAGNHVTTPRLPNRSTRPLLTVGIGASACFSERVLPFVFTLKGRQWRVNALGHQITRQRGVFIWQWNPSGWIWRRALRSSSASTYSFIPGNFGSACHRPIYALNAKIECCSKPFRRPPNLKPSPSDVVSAASSIRGGFVAMVLT
jgi:hypothetical protein